MINFQDLIQITTPALGTNPTIGSILVALLPYVMVLAGFGLLIYTVIGGLQIMLSQGDPKAVASGKDKVQNAIIGFGIMFGAYFVVRLLANILRLQPILDIFR